MICAERETVERWAREGAGAELPLALEAHLEGCVGCADAVAEIRSVRVWAADLPAPELAAEAAARIRAQLIHRARDAAGDVTPDDGAALDDGRPHDGGWGPKPASASARRGERAGWPPVAWAAAAVAALCLVCAGFGLRWWLEPAPEATAPPGANLPQEPAATEPAGLWIAEDDAQLERLSAGPNEVVWLRDGAAWFQVEPLPDGHVFRVIAGDSEVEVVGTRFRVRVDAGRLEAVHVAEGRVRVRTQGVDVADLREGDDWFAPDRPKAITAVDIQGDAHDGLGSASEALRPGPSDGAAEALPSPTAPAHPTDASPSSGPNVKPSPQQEPPTKHARAAPLLDAGADARARSAPRTATDGDAPGENASSPATRSSAQDDARPGARARPGEPAPDALTSSGAQPTDDPAERPRETTVDEHFADAWALFRDRRFTRAAAMLDTVAAMPGQDDARRAEILYWAARAHAEAGSRTRAVSRLERSLRLSPDGWWAEDATRLLEALAAAGP